MSEPFEDAEGQYLDPPKTEAFLDQGHPVRPSCRRCAALYL